MYEVFAEGEVEGKADAYKVYAPDGSLIETYKVNHRIATSDQFAKGQAHEHAARMNKYWTRKAA